MNPNDYVKQKERALTRKLEIIQLKGGKCEKCGYDKNIAALELHHLNPKEKSFQLDARHLSNTTREKILEEAEKCILVCSNCHKELHHPTLEKDNLPKLLEEMKSKHVTLEHKTKKCVCKRCGKEFDYVCGKIYCSDECRNADLNEKYPPYEKLIDKYSELKSWEKVAKYFGITRRIIQRLRKLNE